MHCPKCRRLLMMDTHICPYCQFDLSIFLSFEKMKSDLGKIRTDVSSFMHNLNQLQEEFLQFEESLPILEPEPTAIRDDEPLPAHPPTTFTADDSVPTKIETETDNHQRKLGFTSPQPLRKERSLNLNEFEVKLGQKWLLIVGVVLSILAVGWFLKYSFEKNWIGPAVRIAMAYLAGAAFLGCGELFRKRNFTIFGLYLIGGGIATLYFASFAAFQIYHLLPQIPAFAIMIVTTILACVLALVYDTKWLAVLGLIGGFATPILLTTGVANQVGLMTYMTILNAGILVVAFFKQWRMLNYLGFAFTWVLFSAWYIPHYGTSHFWITTIYLNIFFLTYALVPFAYHMLREHGNRLQSIGLITPNAFIAFGYSFAMIKAYSSLEMVSVVTLIYAAIFLYMAQHIYRRDRDQLGAFVLLIAKAIFFLVLTVPILFSKNWITVFWAIQAGVVLWVALKLENRIIYRMFIVISLIMLGKFFLYDYSVVFDLFTSGWYFSYGYTRMLSERLVTSGSVLAAIYLAAIWLTKFKQKNIESRVTWSRDWAICWGVFSVVLFIVLNLELSTFSHSYMPHASFAATSVLWTLFSVALMVIGFLKRQSLLRKCSIGLFLVTMIKVFTSDMSNVSTPYRIISFLVLGLMLIWMSFLYHKFRDRLLSLTGKEEDVA
ncbi:DUF2339 domain-containing protein [candidate division KSB1 bacterium]|nr:DUF2339 domain-containing protein [candidate division KSB1 bacterium]